MLLYSKMLGEDHSYLKIAKPNQGESDKKNEIRGHYHNYYETFKLYIHK